MSMLGFDECKVTNRVFTHRERYLRAVPHVDDFPLSGEMHDLFWFRDKLSEKYELKVLVAGREHSKTENSVLNRPPGQTKIDCL